MLFHQFKVTERPGFIDIAFKQSINPKDNKKALVWIGRNPIALLAFY